MTKFAGYVLTFFVGAVIGMAFQLKDMSQDISKLKKEAQLMNLYIGKMYDRMEESCFVK